MYDSEKGCMVFKDSIERGKWDKKCQEMVMKEYCSTEDGSFDKWKKDGERFLEEDFIDSPSFPFLNDGRPELFELINGTFMTQTFQYTWDIYSRLISAYDFLLYMYHVYTKKEKSCFVKEITTILTNLLCEKECNKY